MPGRLPIHDDGSDALVALRGIAGGEYDVEAGEAGVGDPALFAVQHVLRADLLEVSLHAGDVAAAARLRRAVAREVGRARQHAQVLLLLGVVAGELDRGEGQRVRQHAGLYAGAAVRELLGDQRVLQLAHRGAAVLRGYGGVDQPELPGLFEDVAR